MTDANNSGSETQRHKFFEQRRPPRNAKTEIIRKALAEEALVFMVEQELHQKTTSDAEPGEIIGFTDKRLAQLGKNGNYGNFNESFPFIVLLKEAASHQWIKPIVTSEPINKDTIFEITETGRSRYDEIMEEFKAFEDVPPRSPVINPRHFDRGLSPSHGSSSDSGKIRK